MEYSVIRAYMRKGDGFILVYSSANNESFDGLRCHSERNRVIKKEQAANLALELNCPFFETSAETSVYSEVFLNISEEKEWALNEAQSLLKVRSPYVVEYYTSWQTKGQVCIQMELCSHNLRDVIDDKPQLFDRTDGNGKFLRLCDFGLAKFHDRHVHYITANKHTADVGDMRYMAPEVAQGKNVICDDVLNISDIVKNDYGTIEQIQKVDHLDRTHIIEYLWKIPNFWELVETEQELVLSSRFYTREPGGYRLQMMLIPNTTYSDNQGYVGTFFRLVTGIYDSVVEWPYKLKTVISIVNHRHNSTSSSTHSSTGSSTIDYLKLSDGQPFTVVPNTDSCRLRSAFLRPSADQDFNPNPDGCGNRRHIALDVLADHPDQYFLDNSLFVKLTVHLRDYGTTYRTAELSTKYNQMVSYYEWPVRDYMQLQNQSLRDEKIAVVTSEPFYTHRNGYLMQLFLTLLPKRNAFAISLAMAQGDYDRYLQWPFPYKFEVAIVDQS
ncbi:unnamed protein product, partial [Oppiella nova]